VKAIGDVLVWIAFFAIAAVGFAVTYLVTRPAVQTSLPTASPLGRRKTPGDDPAACRPNALELGLSQGDA